MPSTISPLQAFRDLLSSEDLECIPEGVDGDEYLMRFLRFKSDPRRAYKTLVKYHEFRKNDKGLFDKMRPSTMKNLLDSKIVTKLPENDAQGRPVVLINCKQWDEKVYSAEDLILMLMMILEEIIRTQVSSISVIIDWEGYGFSHYRQLSYRNIVRSLAFGKGSFPISYMGIHQVNQSKMFSVVSKVLFSFFSEKLKQRMYIHGNDRESLAKYIPFSSLPVYYGGSSEGDVDTTFMDEMYKNEKYYETLVAFDKKPIK
ncbi:Alpha-tocopherol transfer protein-like [Orchesella cincta]|uniref:Alpha-tocopherol transfer protein-like n=1 Tax=Orchesella cincta TaxID=48709 RepID=A0A1D2MP68_ORCCI|nr:Alpha-tocopherol transfer protein-like [Orchesella cincta]